MVNHLGKHIVVLSKKGELDKCQQYQIRKQLKLLKKKAINKIIIVYLI